MTSQAIPRNVCALEADGLGERTLQNAEPDGCAGPYRQTCVSPSDAFRAVLALNPQPTWICDAGMSRFLDVNDAAIARYGYSREEFLSLPVEAAFSPTDVSWRHRTKCGQTFYAGIRASRISLEDRDATLVVAQDIPAQRRVEDVLAASYALGRLFSNDTDVIAGVLSCLCRSLEFAAGDLWALDDDGESLRCTASWRQPGLDPVVSAAEGSRIAVGMPESILSWVLKEGKPCWTRGIVIEPGYADRSMALKNAGIVAATAFSVGNGTKLHGIIVLLGRSPKPPDPHATQLMEEAGAQLGGWMKRRQIAEEIRNGEETFRTFFDDAPFPYHETDSRGVVTRVNKAECDLLGVEASQIVGRPVWDFATPEERMESRKTFTRYFRQRRPIPPFERTRRTAKGDTVFRVHARLMMTPAGEVTGVRTAMLDLSEAARAQQQAEHRTSMLDQVNDAVMTLDPDFRVTWCNAAAERLFGWPDGTAAGQPYRAVAGTVVTPAERKTIHADILERGSWNGEIICTKKDGTQFVVYVSWSVLRDHKGNPTGIVGIHRDVTAPKQMEQALRASEDRLRLAQSMLALGTWEADLISGTVQCSEQLLRMYGQPDRKEPFPLEEWHKLVHPNDLPAGGVQLATLFQEGETVDKQFRVVWPDGTVRWLHSKALAVFEKGQPVRAVGIDFDITEHKQTEERLRILSSAVEQCPVSIVITNQRAEIEYVNASLTTSTGYTLDDLKGKAPTILSSPDTPPEQFAQMAAAMSVGEWRGIIRGRRKDGRLSWQSAVMSWIRDENGNPTHQIAIAEDITERLRMEAELKLSEERFRIAAESSGDSIYEWDLRSDLITVADAGQRDFTEFGLTSPWTAREFRERFYHPEDRPRLEAAIRHTIETGEHYCEEFRILMPDGEVKYYAEQASVVCDASGHAYKWIGVTRDVTEQRKVERANAELAAIVQCADVAIISSDLERNVLTWNRGAERMYGYAAEEMIGRSMEVLVPSDLHGEYRAGMDKVLRGEAVNHRDVVAIRKSGERIPVLLTLSPIRDRDGRLIGVAHVAENITHVKQLERQLAQNQKLESIGQLAAGIAHEINTPIQYIGDNGKFLEDAFADLIKAAEAGRAQTLDEGSFEYLRGEVPKAIEQLLEGVDHVARIVRAMKEFSHPGPVEKTPININRAIESTALVSKNEWKYVAKLTTGFDPDLPAVPCIAGEFNQVILNLIINAAHAVADVVGDSGARGTIHVSTKRDGDFAEIRVSDTGCGIPAAIQAKIFDPFFTTKPIGKGTGQGLAIAHSVIVQKHGGSIHFESEPGRGTTFILRLPFEYELEAA